MKRFLLRFAIVIALLAPAIVLAAPVCTAVNFSASTSGTSPTQNLTLPTGHAAGDLNMEIVAARSGSGETASCSSGYTLLKAGASSDFQACGKIDGGSETNPSVTWSGSNMHVGFMLTLRSSTGWPSIGSIVVDSVTGTSTVTVQRYRSLTVTTDNTCAVQASAKNTTTALSTPTVNVTSGYTAGGIGFNNSASSIVASAQFQSQTAHTNLSQNDETINGNTDSTTGRGIAFTLAMSASTPPVFSVAPTVNARTTSSVSIAATTDCTDCTMYVIEQTMGDAAPSVAQIKAGQDHTGGAAFKACNAAMTANVQGSCTLSSITDGTGKDAYIALNSTANGDIASASSIASVYKIPAFTVNPTFSSVSTGGATYTFTLDGPGTIFGVSCKAGSTAATVAQVEAGQCTGSVSAEASANTSGTSLVIGTTLTLPIYDNAIVGAYGGQHESATHADTNRVLSPPANCGGNGTTQCFYTVLTSVAATSPILTFNAQTNPDIVAGYIVRAPTILNPGGCAPAGVCTLVVGSDGTFSYANGVTSRQDALNVSFYDYSAQAFHDDTMKFWANNLPPVPPPTDSVSFSWQLGVPIVPIDFTPYCPDPELDAVTVTAVSGLISGMNITANVLSGAPLTTGVTTLTLDCADITGDHVTWH